jgi:hypothetical protein
MSGRVTVIYIGGLGRSGSTLLDRMLGQLPGHLSAGEIRDLWQRGIRENRLCGCGVPFADCPFWSQVGVDAYGGWDRLDVDEVIELKEHVDRHSRMPFLVRPGLWPSFQRKLNRYVEILAPLYRSIHEVGGASAIIDSSKAPSTAYLLRHLPDVDLRAVHLVRDSRGVAYSWTKQVVRPDVVGKTVYMHRYSPNRIAMRWMTRNAQMEYISKLGVPRAFLRYESLVAQPRDEMERILKELALPSSPEDLGFISNGSVMLGTGHTVMGNPVRMQDGPLPLRLDDQWRTGLDPRQRRMVTLLTRPLLRRYGYKP